MFMNMTIMKMIMFMNLYKSFMTIFLMMLCLSLLMMSSSIKNIHPLIMGLTMLMYSILISINLNIFNKSSIYSFIMFLIIIGGFLILFLYFNSFAINNKMIFNTNLIYMFLYKFMMMLTLSMLLMYKNNIFNMILFLNKNLLEMNSWIYMNHLKNNTNIKMLYLKFNKLILFSLIYLLYTLIIIMKIIFYVNPKFLRQLNN